MLKIRLNRTGKKGQPSFRVVVQEHTASVGGKFLEEVGYYRPATKNKEHKFNVERIKHWISMGAQPSDTVAVLLEKEGMPDMDKYIAPRTHHKKKKSEAKAEAAAKPVQPAAKPAEAKAEKPAEPQPEQETKPAEAAKPADQVQPAEPTPTEATPAS
ncbi:30S ribosomal protein S16 [Candidatus Peregrinibacteria bacterium RIFCSPLOWO2_01_FULL_39_12]|nr:MAG: 30S ribosomal protein S16 [Candidatus Peregrinibacteria bacterium RIFCSPLOWO2_01_FULL_39_12]OGJ43058.1 MAG: 30S ribosomal protein S16 [Candidatus Peregrinibacteria bacterium RIFCSPLOWO2_02_FULL_39_10]